MRARNLAAAALAVVALGVTAASLGQLPAGNPAGVATGHIHLAVPDLAQHRQIWIDLGAEVSSSGRLELFGFPGMFILLTEREPTGPAQGSTADHIGFFIQDYETYRATLERHGASFVIADEDMGLLFAELPGGVRVELRRNEDIGAPIEFHHVHLAALDGEAIRDWYVDTFGAEASSRRNLPSAVVPGGRVDFLPAQTAPAGTQGRAIDHIGFEVDDMDAFAATLRAKGIEFDRGPLEVEAIGLKIAFITDPIGTYIELTEGLRGK